MNHNLVPIPGHEKDQTCTLCAACLRENGDWYLVGIKWNSVPVCRTPPEHRPVVRVGSVFRAKHHPVLQ
jgi:hypothetical protein